MNRELEFNPCPFLKGPHAQTIFSSLIRTSLPDPVSVQKIISLSDGDRLSLEITTPVRWKPTDKTVLLVHGLCGSHRSPNLVRMARRLKRLGVRAIRVNMRGAGSGKGLARQFYHSGRSQDLFEAIQVLKIEHPESEIALIGFSLGGNVVLKLAGELGTEATRWLKQVIAVSVPVDLSASIIRFAHPDNRLYDRHFSQLLRKHVLELHQLFPEMGPISIPKNLKVVEFDERYTAPRCGFSSAADYYEKCSSIHYVSRINLPCKILLAEDDPIVSASSLDEMKLPSFVELFKTKRGGHMGYLGDPRTKEGFRWLDSLLVNWIQTI